VECPSISPDGTRIAFKQAVPGFGWVPAIVDLKTMQQTTLDEASSLDDQIEWLDASQIIYELRAGAEGELRVRDARANTPSKRWLGNASSPAVTRP
jgi:Tol biopolymer transport system component